jgi:hypothetical protein
MPLKISRSSTRGTPCDSGKYGSIRRICASDKSIKSLIAISPSIPVNQKKKTSQLF